MKVIGLTGGMGSGKTTVANLFAKLGTPIIDADLIAHQLTVTQSPAWQKIVEHFGQSVLKEDKTLDRRKLRALVFENAKERQWLESLLHPLVRQEIKNQVEKLEAAYCLVVIPLLVETGPHPYLDRILVVDAPEALQIERLKTRDQSSKEAIQAILKIQVEAAKRLAAAHDVIHNDSDLKHLNEQVLKLDKSYRR